LAKFVETLMGSSLHENQPKLFKELNSMQNSGCHGNQKKKLKKNSFRKPKKQ
jgi:hypothetical protein